LRNLASKSLYLVQTQSVIRR